MYTTAPEIAPTRAAPSVRGFFHHGLVTAGEETYPCEVANMLATGATLHFGFPIELPDHFTLRLRHDGKLVRLCSVTWDEGTTLGVVFEREGSANGANVARARN
jgi:hypothetical protein